MRADLKCAINEIAGNRLDRDTLADARALCAVTRKRPRKCHDIQALVPTAQMWPSYVESTHCLGLGTRRLPLADLILVQLRQQSALQELQDRWIGAVESGQLGKHFDVREPRLPDPSVEAGIGAPSRRHLADHPGRFDLCFETV